MIKNNNFLVLENYFDILIQDEKSHYDQPICVLGVAHIIHEIYLDIKANVREGELQKLFAKEDIMKIYAWKNNRYAIQLSKLKKILELWKSVCRKSDYDVQLLWDEMFYTAEQFTVQKSPQKIDVIKVLDEELAYLLGALYADGSLRDIELSKKTLGRCTYEITITDHLQNNIVSIVALFNKTFGLHTAVKAVYSGKWYRMLFSSLVLHKFFNKVCFMPTGYKKGKLRIPNIIKSAPLNIQKRFISGVFDGDGMSCFSATKVGKGSMYVSLSQSTREFLEDMQKMLWKMNIPMHIYEKRSGPHKYFVLESKKQATIQAFYDKINFNYKNKKEKLQTIVDIISR